MTKEENKTPVEWLINQLSKQKEILKNHFEGGKWNDDRCDEIDNSLTLCEHAKQMEYDLTKQIEEQQKEIEELKNKPFWHDLEKRKPHSYKRGNWDGLMSDQLLFEDKNGIFYTGNCYQGFMDGSEFCSFYNQNDFEIENIIRWADIPD